ncbi:hypothetical protein GCM10025738_16640 [Microbacterium fluvii]
MHATEAVDERAGGGGIRIGVPALGRARRERERNGDHALQATVGAAARGVGLFCTARSPTLAESALCTVTFR